MAKRYEDRYRSPGVRRDREGAHDRGPEPGERGYVQRASDEVRSWFGDREAEQRRREDESRSREHRWRDDEPGRYQAWSGPSEYGESRSYGEPRQREWSDRDWSERSRWYGRDFDRERDWYGRGREGAGRQSEWRDRDRDWSERERDYGGDYEREPLYARDWERERDWSEREPYSGRERESRWSADEGRTEFGRAPSQAFGYRYAGGTGTWQQHRGRGPKGYQRSDQRIYEDVCERLSHTDIDAENIEVKVSNGEVTLSGSVRHRWDKRRAEDIAENVSGVREVHNSVRVNRESGGLGMSDTTSSDQPGSVLGTSGTGGTTEVARTPGTKRTT